MGGYADIRKISTRSTAKALSESDYIPEYGIELL